MAPCDQDSLAALDRGKDLFSLVSDRGPVEGLPTLFKVVVDLVDTGEVVFVQTPESFDAIKAFGFEQIGRALHLQDAAGRFKGVGEALAVDLLKVAGAILTFAVSVEDLWIFGKDAFTTGVDAEVVDAGFGESFTDRVIFFFALLPSGGDQSEIAFDPKLLDDMRKGRFMDLRAKDKEPGGRHSRDLRRLQPTKDGLKRPEEA